MNNLDLQIFANTVDGKALNQIYEIAKTPAFEHAKIRIMPDTHAGAGCVIGFTATGWSHIIANVIGVDIGCGMLVAELGNINIDYEKLDETINKCVPAGFNIHEIQPKRIQNAIGALISKLRMPLNHEQVTRAIHSIGTLGGGNHFIEVDQDEHGNKFLVIHTGSRNLGKICCKYYQKKAVQFCTVRPDMKDEIIQRCKAENRIQDIQTELENLKKNHPRIDPERAWLSDQDGADYMHDMRIIQTYAQLNRQQILNIICQNMNWKPQNTFESIHNYIDFMDDTIRKGAISAGICEKLIIPLNMRDGCIIGFGKGNDEWNRSAPHGAGRLMSRAQAKEQVDMEDFQKTMEGIYTTSVTESTKDESPFAYKPAQEIIDAIGDTVTIDCIVKPMYNFKAH